MPDWFDHNALFRGLHREVYGNTIERWAIALAILVVVFVLLRTSLARLAKLLARLTSRTSNGLDDTLSLAVEATRPISCFLAGLALALTVIDVPKKFEHGLDLFFGIALTIQFALWVQAVMRGFLDAWVAHDPAVGARRTLAIGFGSAGRFVLWALVIIAVLSFFGVRVNALLAGLGVGGVAAALAVQSILGDLFASMTIFFDRPFDIGDSIVVDTFSGTITHIGWRSTHLRADSGEQIVLPNGDLMRSRIRNFKRMTDRRVMLVLGVAYDTPAELIERAPTILREAIEAVEGTTFLRAHFKTFGANSLDLEAVYTVDSSNFTTYMDQQQAVNLGVLRGFGEAGIAFAISAQNLRVVSSETKRGERAEDSGQREAAARR